LCGFTLFLSLILNRTSSMVFDLLEIKEKWRKLEASGATLSGTEKSTASVEEENAKLKLKIEALKTEKQSLLKKSKALSDEY
jgi:B-cell receptor-associated protein 31